MNNRESIFWDIVKELILIGIPVQKVTLPEDLSGVVLALSVFNKDKIKDDSILFNWDSLTESYFLGVRNVFKENVFENMQNPVEVKGIKDIIEYVKKIHSSNDFDLLNKHAKMLLVYKGIYSNTQKGKINHFGIVTDISYININDEDIQYEINGEVYTTKWKSLIMEDCLI